MGWVDSTSNLHILPRRDDGEQTETHAGIPSLDVPEEPTA